MQASDRTDLSMTTQEFQLLRDLIEKFCGIAISEEKAYLIENRLTPLVFQSGCASFLDFYTKVSTEKNESFRHKIIDAMTTNETLWLRDQRPFNVLKEILFPRWNEQLLNGEKKEIRIWSAACSTGQEPYSVAMMAREVAKTDQGSHLLLPGKLSIVATDISPSVLILAKAARYDRLSMSRGMQPELKEAHFEEQNQVWQVKPEIKNMVSFQQFNLQDSFASLGQFDLILLRNVAIYFSRPFKESLFKRMAKSLEPNGYFFLGASESLIGYDTPFIQKEALKCYYYQLGSSTQTKQEVL